MTANNMEDQIKTSNGTGIAEDLFATPFLRAERPTHKEPMSKKLFEGQSPYLKRYQNFFIGRSGIGAFLKFEVITELLGPLPGAVGLFFRKYLYPCLFKEVGSGVLWGRNISLRHAGKIRIGNHVVIDDNCLLDAQGSGEEGIRIGNDVLIARDTIIQGKNSWIRIGDGCNIGSQCQLSSAGGIHIGKDVGIAGKNYIGGGRYRTEDPNIPMIHQESYSKGPVIIEDGVWVGAGAVILDGVRIGKGSFVGAGAIVTHDIEEFTLFLPHQKAIRLPRFAAPPSYKDNLPSEPVPVESLSNLGQRATLIVFSAVEEINQQLPKEYRLEKSGETILFVNQTEKNLDSLGLLNLVVTVEQKVEEEFGLIIDLANEELMTQSDHPFRTMGTLVDYISRTLEQKLSTQGEVLR